MQKGTVNTKVIELTHVDYYCDTCGKFIDSADEYDDGYIPESKGNYGHKIRFEGKEYGIYGCFCDECKEILKDKILRGLKIIGYKEVHY